jgi:hypothetical protein
MIAGMNRSRVAAPFHLVPVAAFGMTLAVVLGACGASATPTPPPDPRQILLSGATALTTLKSVHVDVELSGTIQNPGSATASAGPITLDGTKLSADIDIANQKGTASLVTPAGLGGLSADLIVSGDIYVKAPLLLKTDKWSQIPAAVLSSLGSGALSSPLPAASAGVADLSSLLSLSGITVTSQGTDACADGTCNKIAITIPAATLQQAAGAAASANPLGGAVPGIGSLGSLGDATVTVWTATSSGRLNKLTFAASAGSAGNVMVTVTLSKFDTPVTVTPPPADQVQPFSLGG